MATAEDPVATALANWNRDWHFAVRLFGEAERQKLEQARRFNLAGSTVAICSYENPWARAGGLYAVAERLAIEYGKRKQENGDPLFAKVFVVSPYHVGLRTIPEPCPIVASIRVDFGGIPRPVEVHRAEVKGVVWYLLRAGEFFRAEGGRSRANPYLYASDAKQPFGAPMLLRDALFFSRAIPQAVAALGYRERVIFHLKDWQTGLAALTGKQSLLADDFESLQSAAFVFTQHNPYDHPLTDEDWRELTDLPVPHTANFSVQNTALRLMDAPPTVVSRNFARELTADTLHQFYFAPHLQELLGRGVVGVDNGPFVEPKEPKETDPVKAKNTARAAMLKALDEFQAAPPAGLEVCGALWGDESGSRPSKLKAKVPVFVMSGRLDPRQKGFDILASAIEQMLQSAPWSARFIVMPETGDAPESFVRQWRELTGRFPGQVSAVLGRMPFEMFKSIQAGATYSVWPSIYEPFGGVSEYTLVGTPCVARQTGGLVQQVIDIGVDPEKGTGILYATPSFSGDDWRAFLDADPAVRANTWCGRNQIDALRGALERAAEAFAAPAVYRKMLENLRKPDEQFSWERAVNEYRQVFQRAVQ